MKKIILLFLCLSAKYANILLHLSFIIGHMFFLKDYKRRYVLLKLGKPVFLSINICVGMRIVVFCGAVLIIWENLCFGSHLKLAIVYLLN